MAQMSQPDWLTATLREAAFRRGLVLYGNVRDIFYDAQQRQYVSLPELLVRSFARTTALGFTLPAVWDQVDGLRFPDGKQLARFSAAQRPHGGRPEAPPTGEAYDAGDATPLQGTNLLTHPNELLSAIRAVLANGGERPAFVMDWSHLLVGQAAQLDGDERRWMLQLGKALLGGSVTPMDSDHLRQNPGLVVIVAANLGLVPPVLYQDESRIKLINVPVPARSERRDFFLRHADDLRCDRPRPEAKAAATTTSNREALADALADLTDRFATADMRQLVSLSMHTEAPLAPERLLNLYRFGDQRSPWEELSEEKLEHIDENLKRRVIGQDRAVEHGATMVIRANMGLAGLHHSARRSKPKGTLFFVGPTGVGKTELAKAVAEFLFGDESACIRFDMSEYNHEHSDQRLVGAPPGYVGFEAGGQLTNAVRERPFSVLLFDEIEKAHGRILDKFLQILEDGRLTDGRGETAHFSESVIIFTSNIGSASMPAATDPEVIREHFLRAVENHFQRELGRPELLNRLGDNIVVFQPIADPAMRRSILLRKIAPLRTYVTERFGIVLQLSEELEDRFLATARAEHGGRGLLNALERDLTNPLARFLFARRHQLRRGRTVTASPNGEGVAFEITE